MVLQLSLSPMAMRKRQLCYTHSTRPDLESSSKKKVDYHSPPAISLQCRCGSTCSVTLTHRARPGDLISKSLLPILFRRLCFYHGNTRGLNLKNWAPRTSLLEADIWRAEMQSSENILFLFTQKQRATAG